MSKLSFEALSKRADEVVSQELLQSISGGTEDSCHDNPPPPPPSQDDGACEGCQNAIITSGGRVTPFGLWWQHQCCH